LGGFYDALPTCLIGPSFKYLVGRSVTHCEFLLPSMVLLQGWTFDHAVIKILFLYQFTNKVFLIEMFKVLTVPLVAPVASPAVAIY